jgi:hypothetical protein
MNVILHMASHLLWTSGIWHIATQSSHLNIYMQYITTMNILQVKMICTKILESLNLHNLLMCGF